MELSAVQWHCLTFIDKSCPLAIAGERPERLDSFERNAYRYGWLVKRGWSSVVGQAWLVKRGLVRRGDTRVVAVEEAGVGR